MSESLLNKIMGKKSEPTPMERFLATPEDMKVALIGNNMYRSFESTSFTSSDSPVRFEIFKSLNRPATEGFITNDGAGDIKVALKLQDFKKFGNAFTLKDGETLDVSRMNIVEIQLTHVADSSYRVLVA